jgi:hypothetical protein
VNLQLLLRIRLLLLELLNDVEGFVDQHDIVNINYLTVKASTTSDVFAILTVIKLNESLPLLPWPWIVP